VASHQSVETVSGSSPAPVDNAPFQELIPLIQTENPQTRAPADAEAWYGTWVNDRGQTWSRVRIERPLIRIVGIDKRTNTSWVMDGNYSIAANGMMYGVMTALDEATGQPGRASALLEGDERVLRGRQAEKKMMPFSCQIRADGPALIVADFRGTCFEKEREPLIHGRYEQASLGRPSCVVPGPPLGTWVMESKPARLSLVFQPGRFEIHRFDKVSGRRARIVGNYDVAADGIIYGVISLVERGELGKEMTSGHIAPLVLCFHFGFRGNALVIDQVHSLGLDSKTEESLMGEYRPPKPQAPDNTGSTGGGRRHRS
jgi:hypothetical protein